MKAFQNRVAIALTVVLMFILYFTVFAVVAILGIAAVAAALAVGVAILLGLWLRRRRQQD